MICIVGDPLPCSNIHHNFIPIFQEVVGIADVLLPRKLSTAGMIYIKDDWKFIFYLNPRSGQHKQ